MHNDNYTDHKGVKHYGMSVRVNSAYFTGERKEQAEEPLDEVEDAAETDESES